MLKPELLDQLEEIKKIDRENMLSIVERMPEMILEAENFTVGIELPKGKMPKQVVIVGVGGSMISGRIVFDLFWKKAKVPIFCWDNYLLPQFVSSDTLVLALSYSGNTEETLSALREAQARSATTLCVTSGGKMKEIAETKSSPLVLLPTGYQPRAALPYLLIPLLKILEGIGIIPIISEEIKETVLLLQKLREEYGPNKPLRNNLAKQLAKKMLGKIPIVFGTTGVTAAVALRFKTQLNENSKVTALVNFFPELNHNEIVNLSCLKRETHDFIWLVLRDEAEPERIKKRIEITKSLLGRQLGGCNELFPQGKSALARIMSLIMLGDFISVYLAILRGIDPTPVEAIVRLKKELAR